MKTIQHELKFSNLSWNESTDVAQNHQVEEHAQKEVKTDSEQPHLLRKPVAGLYGKVKRFLIINSHALSDLLFVI